MRFGTDTYRAGAMERVADATLLLENGHLAGAVYSAGLSVECMLRSLVWLKDRQLDERHDLRRLAVRIDSLGLLRRGDADVDFVGLVQDVAVHWHNSVRFAATDHLVRLWTDVGVVRRKRPGDMKLACRNFVLHCSDVVHRCEVLWRSQQRKG